MGFSSRGAPAAASSITDKAITTEKIANGAVGSAQLAAGAVGSQKLKDTSVTYAKLSTDLTSFSNIPKRVGKWIDGTPIWRLGFEEIWTDEAASDEISLTDIIAASVKNLGNVRCIIDVYVEACPVIVDDDGEVSLTPSATENIYMPRSNTTGAAVCVTDEIRNNAEIGGMMGWIEFVTLKGNIKTK